MKESKSGSLEPRTWEPTLHSLCLESALDDLDLNEFGVAALEKTFDNSTVPHPSSITIGTGQWVGQDGLGRGSWGFTCTHVACLVLTGHPLALS